MWLQKILGREVVTMLGCRSRGVGMGRGSAGIFVRSEGRLRLAAEGGGRVKGMPIS